MLNLTGFVLSLMDFTLKMMGFLPPQSEVKMINLLQERAAANLRRNTRSPSPKRSPGKRVRKQLVFSEEKTRF